MLRLGRSVGAQILAPIAGVFAIAAVGLAWIVNNAATRVAGDYQSFAIDTYGLRVQTILDTAVAELRTASLLDNPVVEEAKKLQVLEALRLLWNSRSLDGIVVDDRGGVLVSTLPRDLTSRLAALRAPGHFRDADAGRLGTVTHFAPWRWTVVTLVRPAATVLSPGAVRHLLPLVAGGCLVLAAAVFLILRRNFHRPLASLLADLAAGRPVRETGVEDLDTIGRTVNDGFGRLLRKTEQYQLLHNLAVSVHEMLSVEDLLHVILGRAKELLGAELTAIVLYDDQGRISRLYALPAVLAGRGETLPLGKGILGAMRDATTTLCINDTRSHPAFSGAFPPGHPEVTNVLGCPIFSPEGRPAGALIFGNKPGGFTREDEDILQAVAADTAIALAKAESLSQLRRFRQVVESSFNAILIADAAGRALYANPAFEEMTGYPQESVAGGATGFLGLDVVATPALAEIREMVLAGQVWRGELSGRRQDGARYSAAAVVFAIRTEEGENIVSIQRDLTEEKRLAEQLVRAQKMEAIGTLASGIAHDFNNILAGILGYADLLLLQTREGDPFHKAALIIAQGAERGADLARKILLVARKDLMELQVVNLNALVRDAAALLRGSLPARIELVLNLAEGLPFLKADPAQIHQVIMNLGTNARDAMPDGGQLVIETAAATAAEVQPEAAGPDAAGYLRLSVSDRGVGMDADTRHRLYDPFFTTKGADRGTGLGLFIVNTVVGNHRGHIKLSSEPGRGTRICVYLPVTSDSVVEDKEVPVDLQGSGAILVIDDEHPVRELCQDLLRTLGYTVLTAADGAQGLRLFLEEQEQIRVVVLDVVLPKMGGSEVFRALRAANPDARVVLCSGYGPEGNADIQTLLAEGAAGFVQKPFTLKTLGTAIKRALSS